jgi:hypothetical protein
MRNSHYTNPHGLDEDGHYSSPFDLAISGWYLLKNPVLSQIVATQSAVVAGHPLNNLNKFLKSYPGTTGIKPGYTDNAGLCLVISATRANNTVISVIVGEEAVGYNADPPLLFDYSFAQLADPTFQQSIQQGASAATAADYIGRPNGDKLIVFDAPGGNGVINAQVSTTGATPGPTVTTQADAGSTSPITDATAKGGLNVFTLLLVILILLGLVYVALRFTPLGGEKGREVAYNVEDAAAKGLQGLRRFWQYLKPGSHEDEPARNQPARPPKSNSLNNAPDYRTRLPRETNPGKLSTSPLNRAAQPAPGDDPRNSGFDNNPASRDRRFGPETGSPASSFDSSFEDAAGFNLEPGNLDTNPARGPQPPRPLSGRPGADYPPEAAQPASPPTGSQPTSPLVRPVAPSQPTRPNPSTGNYGASSPGAFDKTPPGGAPGNPQSQPPLTPGNRSPENYNPNRGGLVNQPNTSESLTAHARQAIDYAYAGRIAASTEEFKRVIEQNPLFDFGTIDEFEQIPVLGYKALATAYRDTGKLKFAILLLDMAVENYPNELELRNMLRRLRREAGQ